MKSSSRGNWERHGKQKKKSKQGPIAQLGARLNGIEKVESSNLSGSTKAAARLLLLN